MKKGGFKYGGLIIILVVVVVISSVIAIFAIKFMNYGTISFGDKSIAIVDIEGPIYSSKEVIRKLTIIENNPGVGGLIIKINSPGGSVVPCEEIYKKVVEIKEECKIPVYCSMNTVAASGGYYIACSSDKIYASGGTLTGSIGVILVLTNVEELFKKIGVEMVVVKTGEYKDIGSMYREMTEEEKILLEDVMNDIYDQFLDIVYEGRSGVIKEIIGSDKSADIKEYIKSYSDGRIFSGRQAKTYGFVDELGTLDDVIDAMAKELKIKGEPRIVRIPDKKSLIELLFEEKFEGILEQTPSIEYRLR